MLRKCDTAGRDWAGTEVFSKVFLDSNQDQGETRRRRAALPEMKMMSEICAEIAGMR